MAGVRNRVVFIVACLLASILLIYLGRDVLRETVLLAEAVAFLSVTTGSVLVLILVRVRRDLRQSRHELARKEAELSFAREVQDALFPRRLPSGRGLEFFGICIPARGISGDLYDALQFQDGRQAFAIADISGKGISAAILMASLQALLRREALDDHPPGELCRRLNRHFHQVSPPSSFATFFFAMWDPSRRRITYVNAGHNRPLLFGNGRVKSLDKGGFPLGIFSTAAFETGEVELAPGDLLLLYSDGLTEAVSADGDQFGSRRLIRTVLGCADLEPAEVAQSILRSVRDWAGEEFDDDLTVLLAKAVDGTPRADSPRPDAKGEE